MAANNRTFRGKNVTMTFSKVVGNNERRVKEPNVCGASSIENNSQHKLAQPQQDFSNLLQPLSLADNCTYARSGAESSKDKQSSEMSRKNASSCSSIGGGAESSLFKRQVGITDHTSTAHCSELSFVYSPPDSSRTGVLTTESQNDGHNFKLQNSSNQCSYKNHDTQLQDVLKQQAETKETLKSCQEKLASALLTFEELMHETSHFKTETAASTMRYKDNMDQLKMENNALKAETADLNKHMQSQKAQVLKFQLDILELRIGLTRQRIESKMCETHFYMKLFMVFNQSITSFYGEFCNYMNKCFAEQARTEFAYLRLKDDLMQGNVINMSEIDAQLPPFPYICTEVQIMPHGSQLNGFQVPYSGQYDAPPLYTSLEAPENQAPNNENQEQSNRENEILPERGNVINGESFACSRIESQVPSNGQQLLTHTGAGLQISSGRELAFSESENDCFGNDSHFLSYGERILSQIEAGTEAISNSESISSSRSEPHNPSVNEYHIPSNSETHFPANEFSSVNAPDSSIGSSLHQIPCDSVQFNNSLPPGYSMVPVQHYAHPVPGPQPNTEAEMRFYMLPNAQHPQDFGLMPAQYHGNIHQPTYSQHMRPVSNLPQAGINGENMQPMWIPIHPSVPVYSQENQHPS